MSLIEPKIDVLLERTDNDRFLLCAVASKRAQDINEMMRGQRNRAIQLQTAVDIARAANRRPLSLAFDEIADSDVSYDPASLDFGPQSK
ncbi:MAG: DNA-directed RNA polymerase subunit omega [Eggerthellaceae bacterium]|nr:DNA-directed RNA polymerase subunit omega [Eggerthellaceae bacterium]